MLQGLEHTSGGGGGGAWGVQFSPRPDLQTRSCGSVLVSVRRDGVKSRVPPWKMQGQLNLPVAIRVRDEVTLCRGQWEGLTRRHRAKPLPRPWELRDDSVTQKAQTPWWGTRPQADPRQPQCPGVGVPLGTRRGGCQSQGPCILLFDERPSVFQPCPAYLPKCY